MYAGCSDCKAKIHSLYANTEISCPAEVRAEMIADTADQRRRREDQLRADRTRVAIGSLDGTFPRTVEVQDPTTTPYFFVQEVGHIVE